MTGVLVQFLLVSLAGAALFAMWRNVARSDRVFGLVVGLGLMGRSILGQMLFWISWLDLIPRGIHEGRGIWFFGADSIHYMSTAVQAARGGPMGVLSQSRESSAATYLDLLSSFALLFGGVASVGLLLNLFCYVGMSMVIARCARETPEARQPALFALVALTFYPAGVLWSLQPLKDPLLHFLMVALGGFAVLWQRAWRDAKPIPWIAMAFLGIVLSVYGTSGTRWYLGLAVLGASGVFLFLVVLTTRTRRLALAGTSIVLFILLTRAFLVGGGALIPPPLKRALTHPIGRAPALPAVRVPPPAAGSSLSRPGDRNPEPAPEPTAGSNAGEVAKTMVAYTEKARGSFQRSGGGTEIRLLGSSSPGRRWGAGLMAILLPHFVIERLDFVQIGGGRGLFWFADLDTIVFDIVCFTASLLVFRRWRSMLWSNPLFWLVTLATLFIAIPLLYAVTNFGALLRFRGMMYVLLAIAPMMAVLGVSRLVPQPDPR
jgi:hypothetical protein